MTPSEAGTHDGGDSSWPHVEGRHFHCPRKDRVVVSAPENVRSAWRALLLRSLEFRAKTDLSAYADAGSEINIDKKHSADRGATKRWPEVRTIRVPFRLRRQSKCRRHGDRLRCGANDRLTNLPDDQRKKQNSNRWAHENHSTLRWKNSWLSESRS